MAHSEWRGPGKRFLALADAVRAAWKGASDAEVATPTTGRFFCGRRVESGGRMTLTSAVDAKTGVFAADGLGRQRRGGRLVDLRSRT